MNDDLTWLEERPQELSNYRKALLALEAGWPSLTHTTHELNKRGLLLCPEQEAGRSIGRSGVGPNEPRKLIRHLVLGGVLDVDLRNAPCDCGRVDPAGCKCSEVAGYVEQVWDDGTVSVNLSGQSGGAKYDTGKPRMDLMPPHMEMETARVLTFGAAKYDANNWRKLDDLRGRYLAAAKRHINALQRGETSDPESGLHHAAHAVCCLMFLGEVELEALNNE